MHVNNLTVFAQFENTLKGACSNKFIVYTLVQIKNSQNPFRSEEPHCP